MGPKAQHSALFADAMGVSALTKKKDAAYLYVQWATSKQNRRARCSAGTARRAATRPPAAANAATS